MEMISNKRINMTEAVTVMMVGFLNLHTVHTPGSSIKKKKNDHHNLTEILLKVTLNTESEYNKVKSTDFCKEENTMFFCVTNFLVS